MFIVVAKASHIAVGVIAAKRYIGSVVMKPYRGAYCLSLKGHLTQMVTSYGGDFKPVAIDQKGR